MLGLLRSHASSALIKHNIHRDMPARGPCYDCPVSAPSLSLLFPSYLPPPTLTSLPSVSPLHRNKSSSRFQHALRHWLSRFNVLRAYCTPLLPRRSFVRQNNNISHWKFEDLKSIIHGQEGVMPFGLTIHYSMRVSFLQPSVETVKETFTDVQDPKHHLHKSRRARGVENPNYWMELRVTSAGGNQLANFCMPKAMEEVVASEKPHIDFNTLILGKALTRVYESSCTDADATDMRCVVPLAEIWVRDIVSYRNLKLAIKGAEIEDIVIRGNNFQEIGTSATISQPKLAFCGACMKLSTRHHRCGGCKVSLHQLHNDLFNSARSYSYHIIDCTLLFG